LGVVVLMLGATAATLAIRYKIVPGKNVAGKPTVIVDDKIPAQHYDTVLLRKFNNVSALLNIKDRACTYSGVINIVDKADSGQTVKNAGFLVCKQGSSCYFKMGNTETLNNGGIYLNIDHDNKRIFLGPQKSITVPDLTIGPGLKKGLEDENYSLSQKTAGPNQTLILENEKHITCKEYAVTYDTSTLKVSRIFARMTNLNAPLDKSKEKTVDVMFTSWENTADIDKHIDVKKILIEEDKKLRLADKYKNYELIRIQ